MEKMWLSTETTSLEFWDNEAMERTIRENRANAMQNMGNMWWWNRGWWGFPWGGR